MLDRLTKFLGGVMAILGVGVAAGLGWAVTCSHFLELGERIVDLDKVAVLLFG